jgi:hypothetical protein
LCGAVRAEPLLLLPQRGSRRSALVASPNCCKSPGAVKATA